MKTTLLKITYIVVASTCLGCSSDIGNEIIYSMAQPHCSIKDHKTLHEIEMCKAQTNKKIPYEQYKKERKAIIENKN
jgi:hypothetical protein